MTTALLSDDPHHHLSIAYNLIVDNKRIADETAKLSMEEFYNMTPAGRLHQSDQIHRHPERMSGGSKITPTLEHSPSSPTPGTPDTGAPKSPHIKRAKWHLGIRSQSRPDDIMYEVFRAMKFLDFEWKMLNAYHVIVRRKPKDNQLEMVLYFTIITQQVQRNFSQK